MTRYRSDSRSLVHPIVDLLGHAASGMASGLRVVLRRKPRRCWPGELRVIQGGKAGSSDRREAVQHRAPLRAVGTR